MTEVKIKTHIIDATGESLGRLASKIAKLLIGKQKPGYLPNKDMGDKVVVNNIDHLKFWPKKLKQKKYYRYSGYPGGLKKKTMGELYFKDPADVLWRAVRYMLPKNKLQKLMLKRLIIKKK